MSLSKETKLKLYEDMVFIRSFEGRLVNEFKNGVIPGFVHLGLGQEACMAGVCYATEEGDTIGATHREHGVLIAKGCDPNRVMAEIYGRSDGLCKGKGGSMHVCDLSRGLLGNNAILGPGQSIINGFAFANKMRNNKKVAVTMFGDGAANRGDLHEGMNYAALYNLPTIFICLDNGYALSTPVHMQRIVESTAIRAAGYGMPGETVDGNDLMAVIEAVEKAATRARNGEGPSYIELKTYRWRGHFEGDPEVRKTKEEMAENVENNDPIKRYAEILIAEGTMTDEDVKTIFDRCEKKSG